MIFLLGEAYGANEVRISRPFVGSSGIELLRMLADAKIITLTPRDQSCISRFYSLNDPSAIDDIWSRHDNLYRTNVFNLHPKGNDLDELCGPKTEAIPGYTTLGKSRYIRNEVHSELDRLANELIACNPNIVVALGATALWALQNTNTITKYRGSTYLSTHTVAGFKVLPTYHPAAVLRNWDLRPVVVCDLIKAKRESAYPEIRRPRRAIWIEPTFDDITRFFGNINQHTLVSVDIETSGTRITCIGFAPNHYTAIVIPFDDARSKTGSYWPTRELEIAVWNVLRSFLGDPNYYKLFQNGMYDIAFLWRGYGIPVLGATEDTMLLHHALQPESLKGLGFLGSIYSDTGAWKHMRKKHETIKRDD